MMVRYAVGAFLCVVMSLHAMDEDLALLEKRAYEQKEFDAARILSSFEKKFTKKTIEIDSRSILLQEFEQCRQAAGAGDVSAMFRLAEFYRGGRGVRKNSRQARIWEKRALLARVI